MRETAHPTLLSLLADCVARKSDTPAIHFKVDGQFHTKTWGQLAHDVGRTAAVLVSLDVQPGDAVVQVAENRYEWIVSDLAIQFAQAVHVPVHAPLTPPQISCQINHCHGQVVIVSGPEQAEKLAVMAEELPRDTRFASFDPCNVMIGGKHIDVLENRWAEVSSSQAEQVWRDALDRVAPESLATILYTSGTTGEPKGVMLSQQNLVSNTLGTMHQLRQDSSDIRLSFLPFSHVFARTCDIYTWIAAGSQLALAESRETVLADCETIKPTLINGVPYFFDKVRRHLVDSGKADVVDILKRAFGGRLRLCCSGGAALPDHVYDFYQQRGMPVLQGYGLTETSPVISISTPSQTKRGCVGVSISDVEVKIAPDGEILTRGPHVMLGYFKNQQATDEVIRDGWFHTGDLGALDDDGFLRITGRKKEIIVTMSGKNVAPVLLETMLTEDPLILQAMVVGDGRKYLAALIVPDPDNLKAAIVELEIPVSSAAEALEHPEVRCMFEERIKQRLNTLSRYEQIGRFVLMDRGFTIDSNELTPKMSLRRDVIARNCKQLIDSMYLE